VFKISATNRGAKRSKHDFYPTPAWAVEALMSKLVIPNPTMTCLEPCIGNGAIADVVQSYFSEIEWCEIQKGRDFLTYDFDGRKFDFCITNPPYSLAEEFIAKAIELCDVTAMLLRLNFLGGGKRYEKFWSLPRYKPTGLYILSDRPSFTGKGSDATEYAWFIWDKVGNQPSGIHWLRNPEKVNKHKNKSRR
jgi:hypothetical protein